MIFRRSAQVPDDPVLSDYYWEYTAFLESYGPTRRFANITFLSIEMCRDVLQSCANLFNIEICISSQWYKSSNQELLGVLMQHTNRIKCEGLSEDMDLDSLFAMGHNVIEFHCKMNCWCALLSFFKSKRTSLEILDCKKLVKMRQNITVSFDIIRKDDLIASLEPLL